ncbi:MAG TPA: M20/M25/M40 family metallo-hydrolase [Solirubrobacterales bacterium]|nr:M20/M25/M40 family metallo-hydrolase [Solirubrobacterales bacterium]
MPHDPAELLRQLIRFDTTNPPGNEAECVGWIKDLCDAAGLSTRILARESARPNLLVRLPGRGAAPPILLQGHVDVVTTDGQSWRHDPFGAELIDGEIWGRGALDMKGGVAMMLAAVLRLAESGEPPPGDVLLCVLADEENLGAYGARFVVEEHPELFAGVKHALGEFGGARTELAGLRTYPIQVAEKQVCWTRVTMRGPGGHGSIPMRGGAMARLGRLLGGLDAKRLPVHVTEVPRSMTKMLAAALPEGGERLADALLDPERTDPTLDLLGEAGQMLDPMFHNTVNATIVRGGSKANVIPSEVQLDLDGRLLPGQTADDLFRELRELAGDQALELEALNYEPGSETADLSMLPLLSDVLAAADPGALPLPMLLPGVTDGRFFARLGIQTYGFLPMRLPAGMNFASLIHAADERVPAQEIGWGTDRIGEVLTRYR